MSLHVCLGVLVLFIMPLLALTSFLQRLVSVPFWDILVFKKDINDILLQSKGIICLMMLPYEDTPFFLSSMEHCLSIQEVFLYNHVIH